MPVPEAVVSERILLLRVATEGRAGGSGMLGRGEEPGAGRRLEPLSCPATRKAVSKRIPER